MPCWDWRNFHRRTGNWSFGLVGWNGFLTQPFFSTEQFTDHPGKMVPLTDALAGCERILNDEFIDYPESALYMIGTIDEARKA